MSFTRAIDKQVNSADELYVWDYELFNQPGNGVQMASEPVCPFSFCELIFAATFE